MAYDIGDRVKIYTSTPFQDIDGTAIDPTTVTISIKIPVGTTTDYVYGVDAAVVKADTGDYYILVNIDAAGKWRYRISGVDAAADYTGADEGSFDVDARLVW